MAKKSKTKKYSGNKLVRISGWLLLAIVFLVISVMFCLYALLERLYLFVIFGSSVSWGVYVTSILLLVYIIMVYYTLYLILSKQKKAISLINKTMLAGIILAFWLYVVGRLIFYLGTTHYINQGIGIFFINSALAVLLMQYFQKSKRVKNTLVK